MDYSDYLHIESLEFIEEYKSLKDLTRKYV